MSSAPDSQALLQRIVLTGFMGSGKTTVGRILAARLGWKFADLDQQVEACSGQAVPQIFAEQGEAVFRRLETEALAKLLQRSQLVIALGGGAPGTPETRTLLSEARHTAIVHLDAPFAELYARCIAQALDPGATERPLLRDRLTAELRYTERHAIYTAIAHHRANAAAKTPGATADLVLTSLRLATESTTDCWD